MEVTKSRCLAICLKAKEWDNDKLSKLSQSERRTFKKILKALQNAAQKGDADTIINIKKGRITCLEKLNPNTKKTNPIAAFAEKIRRLLPNWLYVSAASIKKKLRLIDPTKKPEEPQQSSEEPKELHPLPQSTDPQAKKLTWTEAITAGNKEEVERLLGQSQPSIAFLHLAARHGQKDILELFLEGCADIEAIEGSGKTLLHTAAEHGQQEIANLLLKRGANIEAKTANNLTPLHMAVNSGKTEVMAQLLEGKADPNATTFKEETPLHMALKNSEQIELLLEHGADANAIARGGTVLHRMLSQSGDIDKWKDLELFIKLVDKMKPEAINYRNELGHTLLHLAVKEPLSFDQTRVNKFCIALIARKADREIMNNQEETPAQYADKLQHFKGSRLEKTIRSPAAFLNKAVFQGEIEPVKKILENNQEITTDDKTNALLLAISKDKAGIVELIFPEVQDNLNEMNVLQALAKMRRPSLPTSISTWLENLKFPDGSTVLHYAVINKCPSKLVKALINDTTIDINCRNSAGETPLHKVVSLELTKLLIEKGAMIEAEDNDGKTVLHKVVAMHSPPGTGSEKTILPYLMDKMPLKIVEKHEETLLNAAADRSFVEGLINKKKEA